MEKGSRESESVRRSFLQLKLLTIYTIYTTTYYIKINKR